MSYVSLAIAIIAEVIATSFLKQSDGFTRPVPTLIVVLGYGLAFYFLSVTLREIPTGVAYAIWSGAGIVLIAAIAWIVQGQKLDVAAIVGVGLIVAGITAICLFSKAAGK